MNIFIDSKKKEHDLDEIKELMKVDSISTEDLKIFINKLEEVIDQHKDNPNSDFTQYEAGVAAMKLELESRNNG